MNLCINIKCPSRNRREKCIRPVVPGNIMISHFGITTNPRAATPFRGNKRDFCSSHSATICVSVSVIIAIMLFNKFTRKNSLILRKFCSLPALFARHFWIMITRIELRRRTHCSERIFMLFFLPIPTESSSIPIFS